MCVVVVVVVVVVAARTHTCINLSYYTVTSKKSVSRTGRLEDSKRFTFEDTLFENVTRTDQKRKSMKCKTI